MGTNELANQLISLSGKKDADIDELFYKLLDVIDEFSSDERSVDYKTKALISSEFIFTKLRMIVEYEHITVKRILTDSNISPSLKPFFVKRDVYLSQICTKLTTIREDINVLQKTLYMASTINKKL